MIQEVTCNGLGEEILKVFNVGYRYEALSVPGIEPYREDLPDIFPYFKRESIRGTNMDTIVSKILDYKYVFVFPCSGYEDQYVTGNSEDSLLNAYNWHVDDESCETAKDNLGCDPTKVLSMIFL